MKVLSPEEHRREKTEVTHAENNYNNNTQKYNWRNQSQNQNPRTSNDYRAPKYNETVQRNHDNDQRQASTQHYKSNQVSQREQVNQITIEKTPNIEIINQSAPTHALSYKLLMIPSVHMSSVLLKEKKYCY